MRLTLVLLVLASSATAQVPDFGGAFAMEGVPCDCDPKDYVFRTMSRIQGHAQPGTGSPNRVIEPNRRIEGNDWSEAWTVATSPQRGVATRNITLNGLESYGRVNRITSASNTRPVARLNVRSGETIEVLMGNGEGGLFIRHNGVVYFYDDFMLEEEGFRMSPAGQETRFLRLTPKPGKPASWIEARFGSVEDTSRDNLEVLCNSHSPCSN